MRKLTSISLLLLLLAVAPASADPIGNGAALLSVNGAWVTAQPDGSSSSADGAGLIVALDVFDQTRPFSIWVSLSYSQITWEEAGQIDQQQQSLKTWPLFFGIRYWLGSGKFRGYLGAGVGVYFSTLETTFKTTGARFEQNLESAATTIPLGVIYEASDRLTINAGYSMSTMFDNTFLEGSTMHSVGLGVGFSFGS